MRRRMFMLAAVALTTAFSGSVSASEDPVQTPQVHFFRLVSYPQIQRELKLEPKQLQEIDTIRRSAARAAIGVMRTVPGLGKSRTVRDPKATFASNTPAENLGLALLDKEKQAYKVLKPQQAERMRELTVQMEGIRCLLRPEIRQALKFQPEQQKAYENVLASERIAYARAVPKGAEEQGVNPLEVYARVKAEFDRRLFGLLTANQKKTYEDLRGQTFILKDGGK